MKRTQAGTKPRTTFRFPPVNSGGLIEAFICFSYIIDRPTFPPVNSGGLIEAYP